MDSSTVLREVRRRSGLSLRDLARRASTSHSAIAAYENGRVEPSYATLDRIVRAAGCELRPEIVVGRVDDTARSREFLEVLELAELFPAHHQPFLDLPCFGAIRAER